MELIIIALLVLALMAQQVYWRHQTGKLVTESYETVTNIFKTEMTK